MHVFKGKATLSLMRIAKIFSLTMIEASMTHCLNDSHLHQVVFWLPHWLPHVGELKWLKTYPSHTSKLSSYSTLWFPHNVCMCHLSFLSRMQYMKHFWKIKENCLLRKAGGLIRWCNPTHSPLFQIETHSWRVGRVEHGGAPKNNTSR